MCVCARVHICDGVTVHIQIIKENIKKTRQDSSEVAPFTLSKKKTFALRPPVSPGIVAT